MNLSPFPFQFSLTVALQGWLDFLGTDAFYKHDNCHSFRVRALKFYTKSVISSENFCLNLREKSRVKKYILMDANETLNDLFIFKFKLF